MKEMRDLFHKIGNYHNKICVGAGLCKMELEQEFNGEKLPQKTLNRLVELQDVAVEATDALRKLKDIIAAVVDLDTGKPKSQ